MSPWAQRNLGGGVNLAGGIYRRGSVISSGDVVAISSSTWLAEDAVMRVSSSEVIPTMVRKRGVPCRAVDDRQLRICGERHAVSLQSGVPVIGPHGSSRCRGWNGLPELNT